MHIGVLTLICHKSYLSHFRSTPCAEQLLTYKLSQSRNDSVCFCLFRYYSFHAKYGTFLTKHCTSHVFFFIPCSALLNRRPQSSDKSASGGLFSQTRTIRDKNTTNHTCFFNFIPTSATLMQPTEHQLGRQRHKQHPDLIYVSQQALPHSNPVLILRNLRLTTKVRKVAAPLSFPRHSPTGWVRTLFPLTGLSLVSPAIMQLQVIKSSR